MLRNANWLNYTNNYIVYVFSEKAYTFHITAFLSGIEIAIYVKWVKINQIQIRYRSRPTEIMECLLISTYFIVQNKQLDRTPASQLINVLSKWLCTNSVCVCVWRDTLFGFTTRGDLSTTFSEINVIIVALT